MSIDQLRTISSGVEGGRLIAVWGLRGFGSGIRWQLEVLGAFLGPIQTGAKKTERLTRQRINGLVGDGEFVFATSIRSAQSIAAYCGLNGMLSNEYEQMAADRKAHGRRWSRLSQEERDQVREEHTFSDAAPGLAADWEQLVGEVMARFQQRLAIQTTPTASHG